ncbi:phage tail protein [Rhizobium sp. RU36D]|uniref:phage tail protein n=1 Tax=Rhizobium sp. RU36D TaxID=1907415 RepID=UPI0009D814F0|nr:phage tail protein [Rhizobium sp. RU36D]SMD18114.1 Phage tail protein (Tail_P2_I) [Rhizobium sp. RU36D]
MNSLLPENAGLFEQAMEAAQAERWERMGSAVPLITTAKENPPPSFLPFLVWEYGLGMLTPYVPNLYDLLGEGIRWQRLRGTYAGVKRGLSFVGITATIEPAWHGRAWWNSSQLRFPALPENDLPLLEQIEGVTRLSLPFRSDLRRGVHHYDAPPAAAECSRFDEAMIERESGISVTQAGTLWSFGRVTEISHVLTEEEGLAIGNWLDRVSAGETAWLPVSFPAGDGGFSAGEVPPPDFDPGLPWVDAKYPWIDASVLWASPGITARAAIMAAWFVGRSVYVTMRDPDGDIIGHRTCRAIRPGALRFGGQYNFGGQTYRAEVGGTSLYIEAMTDFGDADSVIAASVELTIDGEPVADVPPGRLWLQPGELLGGTPIAVTAVNIPLRATVREQIKFLMRF